MTPYSFSKQDIFDGIPQGSANHQLLNAIVAQDNVRFRGALADRRCVPGFPSASGVTPVMAALAVGTDDMVKMLLDTHLINVNHQTVKGVTALHIAAAQRQKFCRQLRARGADARLKNDADQSPLDHISDADLKKDLLRPPQGTLFDDHSGVWGVFETAAKPQPRSPITAPEQAPDILSARQAILANNPKALQKHVNSLVVTDFELNRLLELSLRTGDQPVIVQMLLTAGAEPQSICGDRKKMYQLALSPLRPHAFFELMRHEGTIIPPLEIFSVISAVSLAKNDEKDMRRMSDGLAVHTLRSGLRTASAKKLEKEMADAVQDKNVLMIIAVFAESRKKHLLRRKAEFSPQLAATALYETVRAGHFLAAYDMYRAGFDIWDMKQAKELPDPPGLPPEERRNVQAYMGGVNAPPRVLSPAERINELRRSNSFPLYPHGPGASH